MRLIADYARVRVPASCAEVLGQDSPLGFAHDLWDEVSVILTTGKSRAVLVGEGSSTLPRDDQHLVIQTIRWAMERLGLPLSGLEVVCRNNIPQHIGLGASSAAVVAGLLLVRALVDQPELLDDDWLLSWAAEVEGSVARVAPTVFGGATIAWSDSQGRAFSQRLVEPGARPVSVLIAQGDDAAETIGTLRASLERAKWPVVPTVKGQVLLVFAPIPPQLAGALEAQGLIVVHSNLARGAYILPQQ